LLLELPREEILVEYTGSIESLVLLHIVRRHFRRRVRVGLLFLAQLDDEWAPVRTYLDRSAQYFGLYPIAPYADREFLLWFPKQRCSYLQAVREWVGPDRMGYRVVLRAGHCDRVLDTAALFKAHFMESRILLDGWPPEAFLGYVDLHQLEALEVARRATAVGGRVAALPGTGPFVWRWDDPLPKGEELERLENAGLQGAEAGKQMREQAAPRMPGERETDVQGNAQLEVPSEADQPEGEQGETAEDRGSESGAAAGDVGEAELDGDKTAKDDPAGRAAAAGYSRDSRGRWRKGGAYIAASKVPGWVKNALGGQ